MRNVLANVLLIISVLITLSTLFIEEVIPSFIVLAVGVLLYVLSAILAFAKPKAEVRGGES